MVPKINSEIGCTNITFANCTPYMHPRFHIQHSITNKITLNILTKSHIYNNAFCTYKIQYKKFDTFKNDDSKIKHKKVLLITNLHQLSLYELASCNRFLI